MCLAAYRLRKNLMGKRNIKLQNGLMTEWEPLEHSQETLEPFDHAAQLAFTGSTSGGHPYAAPGEQLL